MLSYWFLFFLPALAALGTRSNMRLQPDGTRSVRLTILPVLFFALLTVMVGFRYEVGADWRNYFAYLTGATTLDFSGILLQNDPGYWALNFISIQLGWGVTGVNLAGAVMFSFGVTYFCAHQPRNWLALASAIPYLVIVVGMGYTRQGIALSLVMIGFVALDRKRLVWFAICVLAAALFHKSAVIILPIAGLVSSKNKLLSLLFVAMTSAIGYLAFLEDSLQNLLNQYQDGNFVSSGTLIRLTMNVVPAALFFLFYKRIRMRAAEKKLWGTMSIISFVLFAAFFLINRSTALDRIALYLIPLQIVVFSHLPDILGRPGRRNQAIVLGVLLYYGAVLFVWLNFATNSRYWIPYQIGFSVDF